MRNRTIIVLGGAGMLGHKVFQTLRGMFPGTLATVWECVKSPPFDRVTLLQGEDVMRGVDALQFDQLAATLRSLRPDFIVNCIGIIKQRPEATSPIPTITINSLLPHRLAEAAAGWGGRVIHFSTDCVFSGRRGGYTETDPSDAEDLYGRTKYLGEVAAANSLTLRTSIIGRELTGRKSLLEWFLSQNHKRICGFEKVIYSGVTTNHLAELVGTLIERHPELSGLYQVASRPISKCELLRLLRDAYKLDVEIVPDQTEVCDRSLNGDKLRQAVGYVCPLWPELVSQLASDETPYQSWVQPDETF
jgi:dTDP-4-dehydrorhamnose reductase